MYTFLMFFKVFSVRYLLAWANFVSFVRISIPWSAFWEAAVWMGFLVALLKIEKRPPPDIREGASLQGYRV